MYPNPETISTLATPLPLSSRPELRRSVVRDPQCALPPLKSLLAKPVAGSDAVSLLHFHFRDVIYSGDHDSTDTARSGEAFEF